MATIDNDNDSIDNVTGAVIFAAYVFAALFLTGLIAFDLYQAYHSRSGSSSKEAQHVSNQLQIFVALAVLSFSTLSYHMLSYLIDSYQDWVTTQRFGPIHGLYSPGVVLGSAGLDFAGRVWQWLTQSTLFRDFAVTICKDSANFWWTQQALLVTMASALFMSIEGSRRGMPHLWAYLAIGQILPISFAQSLFFIAMILVPLPDSARSMRVPSRLVQCLPLAAYYISVFSAVFSVGTPSFTSVIVVIRTLLFCPYLSRFSVLETRGSRSTTARDLHAGHSTSYKLTALLSIVLFVYQTRRTLQENEVNQVLAAINSNPAVSALGYDFIIHVVVSFTWFILNPELVDVST